MSDSSIRLWRTLRDLALALLNATLILIAICLFLGLRLASTVDAIAGTAASSLVSVDPLRQDIAGLTTEVADLRIALAGFEPGAAALNSEAGQALVARIDSLDARIDQITGRMEAASGAISGAAQMPGTLLGDVVRVTATEIATAVAGIACTPGTPVITPVNLPAARD